MNRDHNRGDTLFRCPTCHKEETHFFGEVLLGGWPACHGHMEIVKTQTSLSTAVEQSMEVFSARVREAYIGLHSHQN